MVDAIKFRKVRLFLCAALLSCLTLATAYAQSQTSSASSSGPRHSRASSRSSDEHLGEWMSKHSGLTPQQQQQALEKEPGFRDLPPQTQQRMRERLAQLNAMPAEKRQRLIDRNETMEHLSPDQRTQVRSAMKQLTDLPEDQRRYVARTFRGLRELSPAQRQNVLNSERFSHLTPQQRSTLNSLMKVEPFLPPAYDSAPVAQSPRP